MIAISRHWPLIITIIILWLTVALLLAVSMKQNHGHLIYAFDDPYIHMAMAKNFAQHGVWGISRYEFSSSSSSLLWTLMLSIVYFLFGVNELTPLILNILFATATVVFFSRILNRFSPTSPAVQTLGLIGILFLTPLPALVLTGQEHVLHTLITVLFAYLSARALSQERPSVSASISLSLLALAPLVTLIRYEGLFLVFVVCLLFILRNQWGYSFAMGMMAVVPLAIYGAISKSNGWFWLPNSILLKSDLASLTSAQEVLRFLVQSSYKQLFLTPHVFFLTIAALILYVLQYDKEKGFWEGSQIITVIYIATSVLHLLLAKTGWFCRYDAYLVALGLFVVIIKSARYLPSLCNHFTQGGQRVILSRKFIPKYGAWAILTLFLTLPFIARGIGGLVLIPQAMTNIYEQPYQMGLFLKRFYKGVGVAANDIGAINYLADINCLDLWGIGSREVARMKKEGNYYQKERIYDLTKTKGMKSPLSMTTGLEVQYPRSGSRLESGRSLIISFVQVIRFHSMQ